MQCQWPGQAAAVEPELGLGSWMAAPWPDFGGAGQGLWGLSGGHCRAGQLLCGCRPDQLPHRLSLLVSWPGGRAAGWPPPLLGRRAGPLLGGCRPGYRHWHHASDACVAAGGPHQTGRAAARPEITRSVSYAPGHQQTQGLLFAIIIF